MKIKALSPNQMDSFIDYLSAQVRSNGLNGEPLYLPVSPGTEYLNQQKIGKIKSGIDIEVGKPGWRRYWIIHNEGDEMVAHIDLRARDEPSTPHRALLGMGMNNEYRGKGIGGRLVEFVLEWAKEQIDIKWVDLQVMENNIPGVKLYQKMGFELQGKYEEMFCIDGEYYDYLSMTKRVG
ncbi:MAG: GNAT family N-acetyltransferase [Kangiellaceae bacterium]|nr:GNAT family N-acetyltransferase [Kangiellaceae bacterium]MCW8998619.1 GNAT family N-acetyltransferase [Kangiellaceae bacterium]MCW9016133.1 GNAT family N-acetyltransferase [Kangiellaceae bacterium]